MDFLIYKYIKDHKNSYAMKSIDQSSVRAEIIAKLGEHNILTLYDLLVASEKTIESIFYNNPKSVEEIHEYIFSIHSDIIDELDSFPQLEEWSMFLDAVNEQTSIDPLTCVICDENPSAFSMNIADGININVCDVCAGKIKNKIYIFLSERGLW